MKRLLILVAGFALLSLPMVASAGVQGTPHDLTGGGRVCESCHIPHNAAMADKLWARDTTGIGAIGTTAIGGLCWTCHNAGGVAPGADTPFNGGENHKVASGLVGDCSGEGTSCHDVHDNTNTAFMTVAKNGTWCESCHGTGSTYIEGDHTTGTQHYTNGGTFTCNQCHAPHGAATQTNVGTITNPILLGDNQKGAYFGDFCLDCHDGTGIPDPFTIGTSTYGGEGPLVAKQHDYAEANTGATAFKHPTTTTGGGTPVGGCDKCHEQHNESGAGVKYILRTDNTDSQYCQACHTQAGAPGIGSGTHYTGSTHDPFLGGGALPWADDLDDDGNSDGQDWSSATADRMVCETCHSVHGRSGTANGYFLREDYLAGGLCTTCHAN